MKPQITKGLAGSKLVVPVARHDHIQGPIDAPLALVEYGDYECPYCGDAYPVVKAVQRQLGDRLWFAFRNFPLINSHPHAQHAAEAAEAAASAACCACGCELISGKLRKANQRRSPSCR